MCPHSTSLSSPPSWMTWPIDAWLWARMKHCLLHSISCSRSRHIFICSMLALWLSLTIFCFSRNFWSPQRKRVISKMSFNTSSVLRPCCCWQNKGIFPSIDPLPGQFFWHIFLTLPSNSCSEMFFMYTSLQNNQKDIIQMQATAISHLTQSF